MTNLTSFLTAPLPFQLKYRHVKVALIVVSALTFGILLWGTTPPAEVSMTRVTGTPAPQATSTFIEAPLKDGTYPVMETPSSDLVREYLSEHPHLELVGAGTLYALRIKDGKAQVGVYVRTKSKKQQ